jgi:hypothetical protein
MSEFTKLGGYLIEGQPEVAHDNTLSGNGLEGSPLGLSEQVSEANDLVHSNSGDWNRISALSGYSAKGWSVKTTAGAAIIASPISFTASGIPEITGYLTVSSAPNKWCTIMDGGIYLYNTVRGNSAQFIRPDTILKWNNYASGKLNATATANFYTTANESGFISEVPDTYLQNSDLTITNGKVTEISGVPLSAGSAPTYGYTDNGLISAIDTSGLYASSGSANHLNQGGTMGGNIVQTSGSNSFYYMPLFSPWTTADVATGIFAPLQYSTGACLGMDNGYFKAYFKGNEWFVGNTAIGQALRGEVHKSRGVHISGATTAGYDFNLGIKSVSGVNAAGSWKYGHDEDVALRAVSSCDMHESAFEYDANDKISGYNGSAFAGGGGEFPQSATEAIETVTANSADWNGTTDTVSSNSGAWGGSALPISAGPGIKFNIVDDTLIASTNGYVWQSALLFHTDNPVTQTTYTLSNDCSNYDKLEVDFYDINNWRTVMDCPIPPNIAASGTRGGYFSVVPESTATNSNIWFKAFNWTAANTTWSCYCSEIAAQGGSTTQTVNANQPDNPPKVINIIGWKRVGGN